jgi:hypothetical protein
VHDQQGAEGLELAHRLLELLSVERRELVHARVYEEALEPEDPRIVQLAQVGAIAWDGAAPEADVDERLPRGGLALHVQRLHIGRRRDAVQRHVDDRRDTAGAGRAGCAGEALPSGSAGFVHVHMRVDQSREERLVVVQVNDVSPVHAGVDGLDGDDAAG